MCTATLWRSPPRLVELNITGCTRLTFQGVADAVGVDARLEMLRAGRTDVARDEAVVDFVCLRMGYSLRVLELGRVL